jgi:hypothetical protein
VDGHRQRRAVNVLGAVASQRANPYDDDICYTPFVRRLLDAGDLIEPFSFRRLSAFGGQTVLSALAAVRGSLANIYLVDHGLCQLITIALMVGLLRARGVDRLIGALLVLVVALMPDASINTASYWSGAALFLALYRTVAEAAVDAPRRLALAGLVAAAACTLRQNYLPVAIGFLALVLVFRIRRPIVSTLRADRRLWLGRARRWPGRPGRVPGRLLAIERDVPVPVSARHVQPAHPADPDRLDRLARAAVRGVGGARSGSGARGRPACCRSCSCVVIGDRGGRCSRWCWARRWGFCSCATRSRWPTRATCGATRLAMRSR